MEHSEKEELRRRAADKFDQTKEEDLDGYGEETDFEPAPTEAYGGVEAETSPPKREEPEEEEEVEEKVVAKEPEPEPEPEEEPEPEYETLVVDQQERKVAKDDVIALGRSVVGADAPDDVAITMGKRIMQRDLASENRLQDVAKLRSELRELKQELTKQLEVTRKPPEPEPPTVGDLEEQLAKLDERMAEADYETLPTLRTERAKLTRELVRATVREEREREQQSHQELEIKKAQEALVQAVAEKHPNWNETLQDARFQEWLDTTRGGMYRQVIQGSLDPAWVIPVFDEWKQINMPVSEEILNRKARKQGMDTPPVATKAARPKAVPEDESDQDYVNRLKHRRRRGEYAAGDNL